MGRLRVILCSDERPGPGLPRPWPSVARTFARFGAPGACRCHSSFALRTRTHCRPKPLVGAWRWLKRRPSGAAGKRLPASISARCPDAADGPHASRRRSAIGSVCTPFQPYCFSTCARARTRTRLALGARGRGAWVAADAGRDRALPACVASAASRRAEGATRDAHGRPPHQRTVVDLALCGAVVLRHLRDDVERRLVRELVDGVRAVSDHPELGKRRRGRAQLGLRPRRQRRGAARVCLRPHAVVRRREAALRVVAEHPRRVVRPSVGHASRLKQAFERPASVETVEAHDGADAGRHRVRLEHAHDESIGWAGARLVDQSERSPAAAERGHCRRAT